MSGKWDGTFAYPDVPDAGPATPFLAQITEAEGRFEGRIIEPHEFRDGTAHSSVQGVRAGRSIDFTKSYHDAGWEYGEPVAYAGQMSEDGNTITGHWLMQEWAGTFEMTRQSQMAVREAMKASIEA